MAIGIHSQAVKEEFKEHAREEQVHADELTDLLFAIEPSSGKGARPLYFPDAVGSAKDTDDGRQEGAFSRARGAAGGSQEPSQKPS